MKLNKKLIAIPVLASLLVGTAGFAIIGSETVEPKATQRKEVQQVEEVEDELTITVSEPTQETVSQPIQPVETPQEPQQEPLAEVPQLSIREIAEGLGLTISGTKMFDIRVKCIEEIERVVPHWSLPEERVKMVNVYMITDVVSYAMSHYGIDCYKFTQ